MRQKKGIPVGNKGGIPFEEQFFGWNTFTSITVHLFPLISFYSVIQILTRFSLGVE